MMEHSKWYLTMLKRNKMLDNADKVKILEEEPEESVKENVAKATKAAFSSGKTRLPTATTLRESPRP